MAVHGNPLYILHQKIKRLKANLIRFNQKKFGNISGKVKVKRNELDDIQVKVLNKQVDVDLINNERRLAGELNDLLQAKESFCRQKS